MAGLFTATHTFGIAGGWAAWYLFVFHAIKPSPFEFLATALLWAFVAGIAGLFVGKALLLYRMGFNPIRIIAMTLSCIFLLLIMMSCGPHPSWFLLVNYAVPSAMNASSVALDLIFVLVLVALLIGMELLTLLTLIVPLQGVATALARLFAHSYARGMLASVVVGLLLMGVCLGLSYHATPVSLNVTDDSHCFYALKLAHEEAQRRGWGDVQLELDPSECAGLSAMGEGRVFVHRNTEIITCTLYDYKLTCEPLE